MTLNVGVIGVGMIGQEHIRRLTNVLAGAKIVAVSDVDATLAEELAARTPPAKAYATGEELIVPVPAALAVAHPLHYTTKAGDTLVTIADRFNVSVEDLRRWNQLSSSKIAPRRSLFVSQPIRLAPVTHVRAKRSHTAAGTTVAKKTVAATTKKPVIAAKSSAKTPAHGTAAKKTSHAKSAKASK